MSNCQMHNWFDPNSDCITCGNTVLKASIMGLHTLLDEAKAEVKRIEEEKDELARYSDMQYRELIMASDLSTRLHKVTEENVELRRQLHLAKEHNTHIIKYREQLAGIQPRRNHAETLLQTDVGE